MEKSELAKEVVLERVDNVVDKFPDLKASKVVVTLEVENSPHRPGPDLFTVKLHVRSGRYQGVTVSKSAASLYGALAEVVEHMLEKLNRFGDRARVRVRSQARQWAKEVDEGAKPSPLEG